MSGNPYPQLEKSVFIVTYGRSGSTLLQNLLNALPGALVRGENENLIAPLARAWDVLRHSEQRKKMQATGQISTAQDPWFGYEKVTPDAFGRALAHSFIETVLRPSRETRIVGFKEIRWHNDPALFPVVLDFLRSFFPGTRIIFNIRNHEEVMRSGWWKYMNPDGVRRQLEEAEALYVAYAARHPGACLTMRYNSFVTDPALWKPLFEFLEEPFDASLISAALEKKLVHLQNV